MPGSEEAVPIADSAVVRAGDGEPVALLQLEVSDRPELADLLRVIAQEGPGEGDSQWRFGAGQGRLEVLLVLTLEQPVKCSIKLLFDADRHRDVILALCESGCLCFGTEPISPLGSQPDLAERLAPKLRWDRFICVTVGTEDLRAFLRTP